MFIKVNGIKTTPILKYGPGRGERISMVLPSSDENVVFKEEPLYLEIQVRTGYEELVAAPPKSMCVWRSGCGHPLKAGAQVYDLGQKAKATGNSYACSRHIGLVQLLSDFIAEYEKNIHVPEVTITVFSDEEILFSKSRGK